MILEIGLACCNLWDCRESDTTEQLNNIPGSVYSSVLIPLPTPCLLRFFKHAQLILFLKFLYLLVPLLGHLPPRSLDGFLHHLQPPGQRTEKAETLKSFREEKLAPSGRDRPWAKRLQRREDFKLLNWGRLPETEIRSER